MRLRTAARTILAIFLVAASTMPALAWEGVWRIGWLDPNMAPTPAPSGALADFERRLQELGYARDRDYVVEARFSDTYWDRLPAMARDLIARHVDVIVTIGTRTVLIAKEATKTIPIAWGVLASRSNWDLSQVSPGRASM
jgi:putative ABC transport system substrate-binding protein